MFKKVNITETHLRVLALFTRSFTRDYYIREVQKLLGTSSRTALLVLSDLEKKGVLESARRGKIKSYRIKKGGIAWRYLTVAEEYKAISFLENHPLIKEVTEKIIPSIHGIGTIFGSYAKGLERKDSDLDLFVAGECQRKKVAATAKIYGIDISLKQYPLAAFREGIRKDFLIKEVLDSHVVLLGAGEFVRMALEHG